MRKLCILLLLAFLALYGCTQVDKTAEANKALAQKFVAEVWNIGDDDFIDENVGPNYVRHNPPSWDPAEIISPDGFRSYVNGLRELYPDFKVEVHDVVASGEMMASTWTVSGTDQESGKQFSVFGMSMTRYSDGKMVEEWVSFDTQGMMQQLQGDSAMSMKQ